MKLWTDWLLLFLFLLAACVGLLSLAMSVAGYAFANPRLVGYGRLARLYAGGLAGVGVGLLAGEALSLSNHGVVGVGFAMSMAGAMAADALWKKRGGEWVAELRSGPLADAWEKLGRRGEVSK